MTATTDRFDDVPSDGGEAGYEPRFVDVDGVETRYYDVGDGDPLVLAHGGIWGGLFNANTWIPCFESLRDDFRIVAFDRLACGLTDNPDDPDDYRWETELAHALGVLDALDIDTCHVAGSSRGGGLVARMALEAPERIDTLSVINSSTLGPAAGDRSYRGERLFDRYTPAFEPDDPDFTRFRYDQYSYDTSHVSDEHCRTCAWMQTLPTVRETNRMMTAEGYRDVYETSKATAMRETRARIEGGELTVPTLLLFGRNDLTVRLQTGLSAFEQLSQHNPAVRLKLFNECAHLLYREVPAELAETLAGFVNQHC